MTVTSNTEQVRLPDVPALTAVLRPTGGVASVYVGGVVSQTADEWSARWHALVVRLRRDGAPEPIVDAIHERIAQAPVSAGHPVELALFASDGTNDGLSPVFVLPGFDQPDWAGYGGPAHVVPILNWLQQRPPYVLVVTDRAGADLVVSGGAGRAPRTRSVRGPDDEIERNAPGGWSQPRYQHRAEDSWRHNAAAVAHATAAALKRTGARLLIVSGDVRAVQLLGERLPAGVRDTVTVRHITGGRSFDGSQHDRPAAVAAVIAAAVAEETARTLATFVEHRGPSDRCVEGRGATIAALERGRVATLLVTPDAVRTRELDAAVRLTLLTGANVRVLPVGTAEAPAEGMGALCRYRRYR